MNVVDRARLEWLEARRAGVGASDVAGILGVSPWASPWSVWADKVGLAPLDDDDPSDVMNLGRDLEPVIARWFGDRTGLYVVGMQSMVWHPTAPWFATVDGFVNESPVSSVHAMLGVFESKYTGDPVWDEVPQHYVLQCQWAMHCTGFDRAWLAAMHLPFGRPDFHVYELTRDDLALEQIVAAVSTFWNDHVVTGRPPDPDGHPATTSALAVAWLNPAKEPAVDLTPLADRIADLDALKASAKHIAADIAHVENEIKAALGMHSEGWVDGELAVSWREQRNRPGVDADRVRTEYGDMYDKPAPNPYRVLRLHGKKAR